MKKFTAIMLLLMVFVIIVAFNILPGMWKNIYSYMFMAHIVVFGIMALSMEENRGRVLLVAVISMYITSALMALSYIFVKEVLLT